jgi:hypothetical protein
MMQSTPVSVDFLSSLGIPAVLGRTFVAADARPGASPTLVLSDVGWHRFVDGGMDVIGKTIYFEGAATTIIDWRSAQVARD